MKKRRIRKWLGGILAATIAVSSFGAAPATASEAAEGRLGWCQETGGVSYYDETGARTTGWKKISGKWYTFSRIGFLQNGWVKTGKNWSFSASDGSALTGKWKKWKGKWYYLKPNAYMAVGWKKISGKYYYFRSDGSMASGEYIGGYWIKKDGTWDGRNAGGAWHKDKKGWWYSEKKTGWYPKSRWLWIDGACYYFNAKGYLATGTTIQGSAVDKSGAWVKAGKKENRLGAAKTGSLVTGLGSVNTDYTYTITPMLAPFNSYFFIATDNPDPDSFSFVDKDSVYSTSGGSITPDTTKYEDVKYENAKTLRVKGGYIARGSGTDGGELYLVERKATSTTPVYNLTTGETDYRTNYETKETTRKVKVAAVVDDVDYLINTYTKGKTAFFDKMSAVQTGLGGICLYSGVYILGELKMSTTTPYYGISTSPHVDQRYYIQDPYYRQDSRSMLISALYPYRLDSLGFPGKLSAVAKRLDPRVTTARNSSSHYMVDITLNGTTKSYGGQGSGGGQGINRSQILYTFTFDKSAKDASTKVNMKDLESRIREYGALKVDQNEGKTVTPLTWAKVRKDVGDGSYVRLVLLTSVFGGQSDGYTYLYDDGSTTEGISYMGNIGYMYNCWFEGRYYNRWEYYYPGATLEKTVEDEQPSLVFKDATIRLPKGKQYYCYMSKKENGKMTTRERTVEEYGYDPATGKWPGYLRYTYDKESGSWTATSLTSTYSGIYYKEGNTKVSVQGEEFLDDITITMEEAKEMQLDKNTNVAPSEFLIYDMKSAPGTRGTN